MISGPQFGMMKDSAIIVNCARGGIIDEEALYTALKNGQIRGAALDVFVNEPPEDSPLLELDNIHLTPHLGANTYEAQQKAGTITAGQVMKVLRGETADFVKNSQFLK